FLAKLPPNSSDAVHYVTSAAPVSALPTPDDSPLLVEPRVSCLHGRDYELSDLGRRPHRLRPVPPAGEQFFAARPLEPDRQLADLALRFGVSPRLAAPRQQLRRDLLAQAAEQPGVGPADEHVPLGVVHPGCRRVDRVVAPLFCLQFKKRACPCSFPLAEPPGAGTPRRSARPVARRIGAAH